MCGQRLREGIHIQQLHSSIAHLPVQARCFPCTKLVVLAELRLLSAVHTGYFWLLASTSQWLMLLVQMRSLMLRDNGAL